MPTESNLDQELNRIMDMLDMVNFPHTKTHLGYIENTKDDIKKMIDTYIIGADNEHKRDMPLSDPFDTPQAYVNKWKQYQRKALYNTEENQDE